MKTVKKIISSVLALSLITGAYTPVISSAVYYDNSIQTMAETSKSYDDCVVEIREHFLKRDTEFTLEIPSELFSGFQDLRDMIADACNETDNPVGGDYLRWTTGKVSYGAGFNGSTAVITVNIAYRTTAEQEAELDEKVAEILASLDLGSGSDYDKAKAAYDYVAQNVRYNLNGNNMKFCAYGAGIQGEAVCEGYSLLLYRLLMELGIKCRVLSGDAGGPHAWNMAEIDGIYYFMDVTFDSTRTSNDHSFFLKGSDDFDKTHKFDVSDLIALNTPYYYDYYKDGDFLSRFNISKTAYDPLNPPATNSTTTTSATTTQTTTTTTTTITEEKPRLSSTESEKTINISVGETYTFELDWDSGARPYNFDDFEKVKRGGSSAIVDDFNVLTGEFTPTDSGWISFTFYDYFGNTAQYTIIVNNPETTTQTTTPTYTTTTATTTTQPYLVDAYVNILEPDEDELKVGNSFQLDVYENYLFILKNYIDYAKWNSSDESVAEVDNNGYVTINGTGTVTISFKTGTMHQTISDSITFTVNNDSDFLLGDANCDGKVTIADATAIIQALGNPDEYALSEQGEKNADCFNIGDGVTGRDAVLIQNLEAGLIDSLSEAE